MGQKFIVELEPDDSRATAFDVIRAIAQGLNGVDVGSHCMGYEGGFLDPTSITHLGLGITVKVAS